MRKFLKFYGRVVVGLVVSMMMAFVVIGFSYGFSLFRQPDIQDYCATAIVCMPLVALALSISHFFTHPIGGRTRD